MLEPTQYRLNGSGPERSLTNGAGLGSEWRTVLRGPRTPAGASPGTGGEFFADHQEMSSLQQNTWQTFGPISKQ